jgi:hypothetical protein
VLGELAAHCNARTTLANRSAGDGELNCAHMRSFFGGVHIGA